MQHIRKKPFLIFPNLTPENNLCVIIAHILHIIKAETSTALKFLLLCVCVWGGVYVCVCRMCVRVSVYRWRQDNRPTHSEWERERERTIGVWSKEMAVQQSYVTAR